MSRSWKRRSTVRRATLAGVVGVSLAAHAAVVTTVRIETLNPFAGMGSPDAELAAQEPLGFSCIADVTLTTGARLGFCATPFVHNRDACRREALIEFENLQTECYAVQIAYLDKEDLQIRPLLPDVAPMEDVVAAELIEKEVLQKIEEQKKELEAPAPQAQVVEITKPNTEMRPDRARFVSEYDSRVDKETVARGSTEEMVNRPSPRELPPTLKEPTPAEPRAPKSDQPPTQGTTGPKTSAGPESANEGVMAMRGPGTGLREPFPKSGEIGTRDGLNEISTDEGTLHRRGETPHPRDDSQEPAGGEDRERGGGGTPSVPDLRPSEEMIARATGGGSVDKLDGVESGEETALNSKQWKFASFFNRMKRQVAQNWHPDEVYLRRDPTGKVYGTKDRLTVLQVSLTPEGKLARVFIAKQSGVDFLDDEAVRAFREAQPFPNPPTGLLDSDNMITFSFGFHFQIGDKSQWKVFRYQ